MSLIPIFSGNMGGGIQFVGAVTATYENGELWDTVGEAIDVLSVASVGDLVVIAVAVSDQNGASVSGFGGMAFTDINNFGDAPVSYLGRRVVQSGDSNPYLTGSTLQDLESISVVCAVFRNVGSYVNVATATGIGRPDAPSLTASGGLWLATGHFSDESVTDIAAPSGYTLAGSAEANFLDPKAGDSTAAIAYKIKSQSSDNPESFTGTGSVNWRAHTVAFAG